MAQNSKVAALTDELIQSIVAFNPETNRQAYRRARDVAKQGLRAHQYARVSQFDVQASFRGLDEKFRVLNHDDLADALSKRVKEINGSERRSKWMPEFLHLLLQLSDQPTENSKVEALELLKPPAPPAPLTWKEILDEDPYSDEEIWKDVDFRHDSSEDEFVDVKAKKGQKDTSQTSLDEDHTYDPVACVVPVDGGMVQELEKAQFWRKEPEHNNAKVEITELQAVRETLFMLAGLQTSLYHTDVRNRTIRVNQKYVLGHAMQKTTDHLLVQFADMGRELFRLRQWAKKSSSLPLIQTFEFAVKKRLTEYNRSLALLQHKYLVPQVPVAVSLLDLHNELRKCSGPLLRLAQLVVDIEPQLLVNPFVHLETIFDEISLTQMTLEKEAFDFLSHLFLECLQTYLKPIRRWMESGELGLNDETFFIFENDSSTEASSLWHDRFVLRRGQENKLRSPTFLQPAAQKIFNTGKSVVFLKELDIYGEGLSTSEVEPRLDHETVCGNDSEMPLSPFPELFQAAFQTWIGSKYSLASANLREYLFVKCGLMKTLDEFKILYLCANGSVFQDFAEAIFERMDAGGHGWNDRFLLTELARGIFSTVFTRAHAEKVVVRSTRSKRQGRSVTRLADVSLDYALPWPVQNIIQRSSIPLYQQLFTFLLQIHRTKYLVQRISLQKVHALIKNTRLRQLSYKLRQRLIWFADTLRSYLTETVIDRASEEMMTQMRKAEDIDDMADCHARFVARVQEQAMLSESLRPIHKSVVSILDLGVLFAERCFPTSTSTSTFETSSKASTVRKPAPSSTTLTTATPAKSKAKSKSSRRKSFIPTIALAENLNDSSASDSEFDAEADDKHDTVAVGEGVRGFEDSLRTVDREFERLLPFVTAGLRSVGRVGAEPAWEGLAERLGWEGKGGVRS
ncbi:hypothetical protein P280DRAFT_494949 [Massarina eburnea CBS 473.64]|uniref:Spindle pole body component n=1 Tax=Massarina eburnea CBS 473.64 TaxID=1395130 RepID=A0A6A6SHZ8_9PLEO|nr:hypothetical protein P280DRAFT_494949 [Massarina eburnea CBS 473.64]